ncbi:hypothetical protein D3C73_1213520 [compost metagenome]
MVKNLGIPYAYTVVCANNLIEYNLLSVFLECLIHLYTLVHMDNGVTVSMNDEKGRKLFPQILMKRACLLCQLLKNVRNSLYSIKFLHYIII